MTYYSHYIFQGTGRKQATKYDIKMTRLGVFHICIVMVTIIVTCYAREITKECKRINQCQCEIEGEGIIDLAPLDSGTKDHAL